MANTKQQKTINQPKAVEKKSKLKKRKSMTNVGDQSSKAISSIGESASGSNQPSKNEPGPSGRNLRARTKNPVKDPEHPAPAQDSKKLSAVVKVNKAKEESTTRSARGQKKAAETGKPVKKSVLAVIAEPPLPKTSTRATKNAAEVEKKVEAAKPVAKKVEAAKPVEKKAEIVKPKPATSMRTRANVVKAADVIPEPRAVAKPESSAVVKTMPSATMKPTVAKKTRGGQNEVNEKGHMKALAVRLEPLSKKTVSGLMGMDTAKEDRSDKVGRERLKRALPDDQTTKDGQGGSTQKKQKLTTTTRSIVTTTTHSTVITTTRPAAVRERKVASDAVKAKSIATTSSSEPAALLQRKSRLAASKSIHNEKVGKEMKENQSPKRGNRVTRTSAKALPTTTKIPRKVNVPQEKVKKQPKSKQGETAKKPVIDKKEEPAKEQRTVNDQQTIKEQKTLKPDQPEPAASSSKTVITQVKPAQVASTSSATTSAAAASVSPSASSLKIIISDDEDPYSFHASQGEPSGKKPTKKVSKKREAKPKPGNKMDLLIQKEKLDAVGHSCTFQNNPERYEDERKKLVMQINVPAPTISRPARITSPREDSSRYVSAVGCSSKLAAAERVPPRARITSSGESSSSYMTTSFHSKVWRSPQTPRSMEDPPEFSFVSGSPPIQSSFAIRMAEEAKQGKAAPFRVTGSMPTAYYMGVSDDGTPSLSSDVIDQEKHLTNYGRRNSASSSSKESSSTEQSSSMLADSNAENMPPSGLVSSVMTRLRMAISSPIKALLTRSPLKAIPIQSLDVSMADSTTNDTQDAFGFDELIEDGPAESLPGPSTSTDNFREIMKDLKKHLPSKNNKGRVKILHAPMKKMNLMGSPSKQTSVRKFLTSSTPLGNGPRTSSQFGNTSEIVETTGGSEPTTSTDYSNVELFGESSENLKAQRSYERRKRGPKFLPTVEESDSDSEDFVTKRGPSKPKRKKRDAEETDEFKQFVADKSSEFAEVDEYDMIVD